MVLHQLINYQLVKLVKMSQLIKQLTDHKSTCHNVP